MQSDPVQTRDHLWWIVWFQPNKDSDWIETSFYKNMIGSDSKKTLSGHLWFSGGFILLF